MQLHDRGDSDYNRHDGLRYFNSDWRSNSSPDQDGQSFTSGSSVATSTLAPDIPSMGARSLATTSSAPAVASIVGVTQPSHVSRSTVTFDVDRLPVGIIAGITVGAVVVLASINLLLLVIYKRIRRRRTKGNKYSDFTDKSDSPHLPHDAVEIWRLNIPQHSGGLAQTQYSRGGVGTSREWTREQYHLESASTVTSPRFEVPDPQMHEVDLEAGSERGHPDVLQTANTLAPPLERSSQHSIQATSRPRALAPSQEDRARMAQFVFPGSWSLEPPPAVFDPNTGEKSRREEWENAQLRIRMLNREVEMLRELRGRMQLARSSQLGTPPGYRADMQRVNSTP